MKKILLAAAILAVASLNSFGAACSNGTIAVQAALVGGCTINGWTLNTWSLGIPSSNGYPSGQTLDGAAVQVTFASLVGGGGQLGFSVSFSDSAAAGNYFSAVSGTPNQTANFNSNFRIIGAPVAVVTHQITGSGVTTTDNSANIQVQKILYDPFNAPPLGASLGDGTIQHNNGGLSPNPLTIYSNQANALGTLSIADIYQINAGNTGEAHLTSFTNTVWGVTPQGGVPEPMTFVLMGAGLVGIAALRRRRNG